VLQSEVEKPLVLLFPVPEETVIRLSLCPFADQQMPDKPVARPSAPVMCDLIIAHARELITLAGDGPRRGEAMANLGIIQDGAVAVTGEHIVAVGASRDVVALTGPSTTVIDASGQVVMPGFVDAHTHLVFAGDRSAEFEQRLRGASYLDILAGGGGILSTVRATRQADATTLVAQARVRLASMLAHGTTTVEAKSGYGLDLASEMKMLGVAAHLNTIQPITIIPTLLAAHAIPPEYSGRADEYIDLIVDQVMPAVAAGQSAVFCDVFCDKGAFSLSQARRVLAAAAQYGLGLKIHADEFEPLGGAALAAELGAVSADHLAVTPPGDLQRMATAGVIAVLLPGTTFGLGSNHYADARTMLGGGLAVALGSDLNPGTCYCTSMPFIIALACRYLKLTPAEAVCAATINAAYASGVGHRVGSLQPGKCADMIVLAGGDYRRLAYRFGDNPVARVIKCGQEVYYGYS
jgi:imidazolonepropionase